MEIDSDYDEVQDATVTTPNTILNNCTNNIVNNITSTSSSNSCCENSAGDGGCSKDGAAVRTTGLVRANSTTACIATKAPNTLATSKMETTVTTVVATEVDSSVAAVDAMEVDATVVKAIETKELRTKSTTSLPSAATKSTRERPTVKAASKSTTAPTRNKEGEQQEIQRIEKKKLMNLIEHYFYPTKIQLGPCETTNNDIETTTSIVTTIEEFLLQNATSDETNRNETILHICCDCIHCGKQNIVVSCPITLAPTNVASICITESHFILEKLYEQLRLHLQNCFHGADIVSLRNDGRQFKKEHLACNRELNTKAAATAMIPTVTKDQLMVQFLKLKHQVWNSIKQLQSLISCRQKNSSSVGDTGDNSGSCSNVVNDVTIAPTTRNDETQMNDDEDLELDEIIWSDAECKPGSIGMMMRTSNTSRKKKKKNSTHFRNTCITIGRDEFLNPSTKGSKKFHLFPVFINDPRRSLPIHYNAWLKGVKEYQQKEKDGLASDVLLTYWYHSGETSIEIVTHFRPWSKQRHFKLFESNEALYGLVHLDLNSSRKSLLDTFESLNEESGNLSIRHSKSAPLPPTKATSLSAKTTKVASIQSTNNNMNSEIKSQTTTTALKSSSASTSKHFGRLLLARGCKKRTTLPFIILPPHLASGKQQNELEKALRKAKENREADEPFLVFWYSDSKVSIFHDKNVIRYLDVVSDLQGYSCPKKPASFQNGFRSFEEDLLRSPIERLEDWLDVKKRNESTSASTMTLCTENKTIENSGKRDDHDFGCCDDENIEGENVFDNSVARKRRKLNTGTLEHSNSNDHRSTGSDLGDTSRIGGNDDNVLLLQQRRHQELLDDVEPFAPPICVQRLLRDDIEEQKRSGITNTYTKRLFIRPICGVHDYTSDHENGGGPPPCLFVGEPSIEEQIEHLEEKRQHDDKLLQNLKEAQQRQREEQKDEGRVCVLKER